MSPRVPPGVVFGPEGRIEVTIEVRNHGVTPGRVTDLVGTANTCPLDQNMPPVPNYARFRMVMEFGAKPPAAGRDCVPLTN